MFSKHTELFGPDFFPSLKNVKEPNSNPSEVNSQVPLGINILGSGWGLQKVYFELRDIKYSNVYNIFILIFIF